MEYTYSGAVFDDDKNPKYRYSLIRRFDNPDKGFIRSDKGVCFIMLNPSTANAVEDDATIRRCVDFTRRWHYEKMVVLNLFTIISSDPKVLLNVKTEDKSSNTLMGLTFNGVDLVVCAWGAFPKYIGDRDREVMAFLKKVYIEPYCLGVTKAGYPRHPLYVPAATVPVKYKGR